MNRAHARPLGARAELARWPWRTAVIVVSAVLMRAYVPVHEALAQLGYTPGALSLLRMLGCHLVHYTRTHFLWDVTTFALLSAWSELRDRARHAWFLALGALLVPPLACALTPWVRVYAGLSGLVLGLVAIALGDALVRPRAARQRLGAAALLALLACKQLYELRIGNTSLVSFDYQGFATVPAAHALSVAIGVCVGALPLGTRTHARWASA